MSAAPDRRHAENRFERAARRDARRRARARERSQLPALSLLRLRRPAERPGHQASTAHLQAAYPAVTEAGLGSRGVFVGRDAYGGSFVFDPWVLYADGLLTNANTIVFGHVGFGKSALTKCMLLRQRVFGRQVEIIDPKGEYLPLVRAIGGVVLRLEPGGAVRLNPLTRIGTREMREGLLEAVTRAMLARPLTQAEALGLTACLQAADTAQGRAETCIPHVIEQLRAPTATAADVLGMTPDEARVELRECALALRRLCEGPLRGMFDGPTTAGEHAWDAPAVALDLSALGAGRAGSDLAVGIVMACGGAFLDAKRTERARASEAQGRSANKVIRVNDEAWRALPVAGLGEYYQAAFKLSRETGVQHWLVLHRPSDLRAAGDEGTRQQRLAEGLISDAATVVLYHLKAADIPLATELFGLSTTEDDVVVRLGKGEALWLVGGRSFRVEHVISEIEWRLVQTDRAMLDASEATARDRQAAADVDDDDELREAIA
jgi:hypothetical protein